MNFFKDIFNLKTTESTLLLSVFLNLILGSFLIYLVAPMVNVDNDIKKDSVMMLNMISDKAESDAVLIWSEDLNSDKKRLLKSFVKIEKNSILVEAYIDELVTSKTAIMSNESFNAVLNRHTLCESKKHKFIKYSCIFPIKVNHNKIEYVEVAWKNDMPNTHERLRKIMEVQKMIGPIK